MDDMESQRRSQRLPKLIPGESNESWTRRLEEIDREPLVVNRVYRIDYAALLQESIYLADELTCSQHVTQLLAKPGMNIKFINVYQDDVIMWRWNDSN